MINLENLKALGNLFREITPKSSLGINKNNELQVFSSAEDLRKAGYSKLSLSDITALRKLAYTSDDDKVSEKRIARGLAILANAQVTQDQSLSRKVGQFFLTFLELFCYATLVGIPFGLVINDHLTTERQLALSTPNAKQENKEQIIDKRFLKEITQIIEEEKKIRETVIFPDLQFSIVNSLKKVDSNGRHTQFDRDHKAPGIGIRIKEKNNVIFEHSSRMKKKTGDQRLADISEGINNYLINEPDKKWLNVVRALSCQTVGNSMLSYLKGESTYKGTNPPFGGFSDSNYTNRMVKGTTSSIEFNPERNTLNEIEKIHLKATFTTNILRVNDKENDDITKIGTVNTTLTIDVTLDSENKPVISNPSLNHEITSLLN